MSSPVPSPPPSEAGSSQSVAESDLDSVETASSHGGGVPRDEIETFVARARKEEQKNRPTGWWNPDQIKEINKMQEQLHDEALQDFCANLTVPEDDASLVSIWVTFQDDVRYRIFYEVYVAVYEQHKDVPLVHESRSAISATYMSAFDSAVEAQVKDAFVRKIHSCRAKASGRGPCPDEACSNVCGTHANSPSHAES